ncbi:F0F1 ATP synthase subunit epsilon [Rhodovulum tesquicola]|jgi:F-type H+-transporting ATPase subunit epsilon|uniref:ATP synthase epsilon chain n=1 Tax=Rhodovulum steppense TaxID=540251 RepID=A0A4R1YM48_9RHOB|nr:MULTISPECIES: F0F1 ATP synthase subunit epsilon [Rhodovulum]MCO8146010.1 F0F1 ATP synthase subunit epsilon [Rhodovulum tesquicola]TCM78088.1 F-type H+-transporting ATPase subunit epsilon [Rhodovulum steppense]
MTRSISLRIMTPLAIIVDQPAGSLRAMDASGSFGILPGHADFLTRLAVSVVSWTAPDGAARFCAVRGGALTVNAGQVAIATREAVTGDDLATLDREVLARFRAEMDEERVEHVETTRLHLSAMRQMLARLQPKPRGAGV